MSKPYIIIQARMTSTRLPKKVLLPLCDKTVLEIMINRLKDFKDNIIIATTNDGSQKPIVDLCEKLNLKYYEGDTNNVLSRYYEAALKYGLKDEDIIVRCTSDCPLIDYEVTKNTIEFFKEQNVDYVSSGSHCGFPRGMDTEVFRFKLLRSAFINAKTDYEKEHVTPYIHTSKKDELNIKYYENKEDDSRYRLTLDEEDDYKTIVEVYKKFDNSLEFSYEQLISMLKENEYIHKLNAHVEQKKK